MTGDTTKIYIEGTTAMQQHFDHVTGEIPIVERPLVEVVAHDEDESMCED